MEKVLLTDVDGVLLDWEAGFTPWMEQQGYTRKPGTEDQYSVGKIYGVSSEEGTEFIAKFNSSSDFGSLGPWKDSVEYMKRFKAEGWKIITITTAGEHPWTYGLRENNFEKVFGPGVIDEIYILTLHGDKGVQLQNYQDKGYYWVEDKPSNAELGYKYGLKPLLMNNRHNRSYQGAVPRIDNWAQAYKIITG
jgi:hypothetical protein